MQSKTLHARTQKMQQKITKKGVGWAPDTPPPTIRPPSHISALATANLCI